MIGHTLIWQESVSWDDMIDEVVDVAEGSNNWMYRNIADDIRIPLHEAVFLESSNAATLSPHAQHTALVDMLTTYSPAMQEFK
jgi:hypothetical protein